MNNIKQKLVEINSKEKIIGIVDMDEILVNITPLWVSLLHESDNKLLKKYLDFSNKDLSAKGVLNRNTFYLNKWLCKENTPPYIEELILDVFRKTSNFYENCPITEFGKSMVGLSNHECCEKIFIVSRTLEGTCEQKKKWIDKYFKKNKKVEFIPVVGKFTSKTKLINSLNIDYNFVADDELKNIVDIISNTKSFNTEFFIPDLGYNKLNNDLIELAERHFVTLNKFS